MSAKKQLVAAIRRLSKDAAYQDFSKPDAFLAAMQDAERDIAEGRLVTDEEMDERMAAWIGERRP